MKILVTGPAGYIGCKLVPMLLKNNHETGTKTITILNDPRMLPFGKFLKHKN